MGQEQSSPIATDSNGKVDDNKLEDGVRIKSSALLKDTKKRVKYSEQLESEIVKRDVEGVKGAFILDNVLTEDECKQFIELTEEMGYGIAPVSTGITTATVMSDVRDNKRVMWDAPNEILQPIWERVKDLMPQTLSFSAATTWKIRSNQGLNERLRFYRYAKEQSFKPHYDGAFRKNEYEKSHFTFIIYLNDGFDGGFTTFFPGTRAYGMKHQVKVNPKRGSALLFFHTGNDSPLHEGSPHFSDGLFKYVLRSDIMYVSDHSDSLLFKKRNQIIHPENSTQTSQENSTESSTEAKETSTETSYQSQGQDRETQENESE